MKYILLLYLMAVDAKIRILLTDTPLQRIGARVYKKELLTDRFKSPKELTYDSSSRNLFFMYMDDQIQNSGRAVINMITKQALKIHGIEKNKAIAVDPDTSDVYFGSEDGLYKYDPVANEARNIGLYNVNIMKLVVRNNEMFLLDANNHMLYKVYNEGKTAVKLINMKTVMEFEVDDDRNVHFVTMCGVFCAVNGHEIVKNSDLPLVYNFIVSDGRTYGITEDGIYLLDCVNGTAKIVAYLDFVPRSMTFGDYGDIYYSEDDSIYKLRPISSYLVYNIHRNNK